MIDWIKRYKWYLFSFFIVFIVLIPLVINIAFKYNATFEFARAEWNASAAFSFYGTLLAAVITVYGVFLSIRYAQSNYREDVRNRVLPYIVLTHYNSESHTDLFSLMQGVGENNDDKKENEYEEYKMEKVYFVIKSNLVEVARSLTKEQNEIIHKGGFTFKKNSDNWSLSNVPFVSCPLETENVGNGVAVNFIIGFKRLKQKKVYLSPLQLKRNQTIYIHIFSECVDENIEGDYELEFLYYDIYSTQYCQKYPLKIYKDKGTKNVNYRIDFSGKQIKIEEEEVNGQNEDEVS